jgi:hypothetical protein
MIFLYETQEHIPSGSLQFYKPGYPIMDATNQYKFLYTLDLEVLKKIDHIYFVYREGLEQKYYKKIISEYSPEFERYNDERLKKIIYELNLLPSKNEIEDKTKLEYIQRLIQKQNLLEFRDYNKFSEDYLQENEILVYLPYKEEITETIINKVFNNNRLVLFTSSEKMKLKGQPKTISVDCELYFKIRNGLNIIVAEKKDEYRADLYYFKPISFLNIFNDTLLNQLSIVNQDDRKRLQIWGEDEYFAIRVINHLLQSKTPIYYDLLHSIPQITNPNSPLVFLHFDTVNDIEDYKKLYDRTKKIDDLIHIILQSAYKKNVIYFKHYYDIRLPDIEKIKKYITSIFIAFLDEQKLVSKDYYKLLPLIKNNAFLILLNEFKGLQNLYDTIDKLDKLEIDDDLLHNSDLWYYIISEMRGLNEGIEEQQKHKVKKKIIFEYDNTNWIIHGLDKQIIFPYSRSIGLKYIAVLIYWQKSSPEPIITSKLRNAVFNLDPKPSKKFNAEKDDEKARRTILNGITRIKSHPVVAEFCDKYIKYSKYEYSFDPKNEIECEIVHPRLNDEFLTFLNK